MFVHIGIEAASDSSILDPYRCSWYATKTVVLFATNIIEITGLERYFEVTRFIENHSQYTSKSKLVI